MAPTRSEASDSGPEVGPSLPKRFADFVPLSSTFQARPSILHCLQLPTEMRSKDGFNPKHFV
jgi:hypothetical protein